MTKWIIVLLSCFMLISCAKPKKQTYPAPLSTEQNTLVALSESAKSISQSLNSMNATEQAADPPPSINIPPDPAAYGMNIPASLDWQGPAESVVEQIAKASNFHYKVIGNKPSIPILVSISEHHSNLGNILRNVALQCKARASVVVYPSSRTIEFRYLERG